MPRDGLRRLPGVVRYGAGRGVRFHPVLEGLLHRVRFVTSPVGFPTVVQESCHRRTLGAGLSG